MSLQTTRPTLHYTRKTSALGHAVQRLLRGFARFLPARYPRLDLQSLPPHLQRDLGFLDGRDPRYEPAERR
ncbi:hypothetical protein LRX75_08545 [Rhizobium sp. DKSPLA3]|uniref:DUF1127 domain-containing protein n=1 Tax=Rhizobium quercicola TaxID=2901226 RepID=A0A9X1T022_9HYPH|nr:hypothetical protein [Rhizobium quercicola]MCD7109091.1 hypothetical protein [Rhizobium quercicola]